MKTGQGPEGLESAVHEDETSVSVWATFLHHGIGGTGFKCLHRIEIAVEVLALESQKKFTAAYLAAISRQSPSATKEDFINLFQFH